MTFCSFKGGVCQIWRPGLLGPPPLWAGRAATTQYAFVRPASSTADCSLTHLLTDSVLVS